MKVFYYCDFSENIIYNWQNNFYNVEKELLNNKNIELVSNINEADIVFISGYSSRLGSKISFAKKNKKPIIYHALAINMNEFKYLTLPERVFRSKILRYCKKANYVLVNSLEFRNRLLDLGIKKEIFYIPNIVTKNWVSVTQLKQKTFVKSAGICENQKIILGVGSQQWESGIFDFLELAKKFSNLKFVWLNTVENEKIQSDIKQIVDKEAIDNFAYLGYANDMIYLAALSSVDICMFIDYNQFRSLRVFQAMRLKKQIILRNFNSKNEIDLINGINCYKGTSLDDFSWFIKSIINEEANLSISEIDKINEIYDINNGKIELIKVFNKILK